MRLQIAKALLVHYPTIEYKLYYYSLYADGRLIDTKQMILTK
jgi:hypothetical protein